MSKENCLAPRFANADRSESSMDLCTASLRELQAADCSCRQMRGQ